MEPSRGAAPGLSEADVARIREVLASDRRPRVVFTEAAGQIAGRTGQVVRLTDPGESDEWLVVRFGQDELPFSPTDLVLPSRNGAARSGRSGARSTSSKEAPVSSTSTTSSKDPASVKDAGGEGGAGSPGGDGEPPPPVKASSTNRAPEKPASTKAVPSQSAQSELARKSAKGGRQQRAKAPAGLTVTLSYQGGEWTVAAHQGSKVLAKPYLVGPAEALKLVGMIDVPGVQEAVEQLVAAERSEAEQRAEQLRSQLAEVEARLAELRDTG